MNWDYERKHTTNQVPISPPQGRRWLKPSLSSNFISLFFIKTEQVKVASSFNLVLCF